MTTYRARVRRWIRDYGALVTLMIMALGLGAPGLYRLGTIDEQLDQLELSIESHVKPELYAIRGGVAQIQGSMSTLRSEVRGLERGLERLGHNLDSLSREILEAQQDEGR